MHLSGQSVKILLKQKNFRICRRGNAIFIFAAYVLFSTRGNRRLTELQEIV